MQGKILEVGNLRTNFYTYEGIVKALDDISFYLEKNDTLGIVGETGCGKSVTVLSILKLIMPPGKIEGGKAIYFMNGKKVNLLDETEEFMQGVRGNEISMIFQEASNALNPVLSIGDQVSESFLLHRQKELCESVLKKLNDKFEKSVKLLKPFIKIILTKYKRKYLKAKNNRLKEKHYGRLLINEARRRSVELLKDLGIPNSSEVINLYPHELSGGMQQRVVISMALACNPNILIADEPTSNLDVTIQAQILELIEKLKKSYGSSILFITHDLGVVAEVANKVIVLYAGTIAEFGNVHEIFKNPLHPYTQALLKSIPKPGLSEKLASIRGNVPNLVNPPTGCRFHPRCDYSMDICKKQKPGFYKIATKDGEIHMVSCFLYKDSTKPNQST